MPRDLFSISDNRNRNANSGHWNKPRRGKGVKASSMEGSKCTPGWKIEGLQLETEQQTTFPNCSAVNWDKYSEKISD